MFLSKIVLGLALLLFIPAQSPAADADLKPGDVIGPHNWQRVQGMVGEDLLNRIRGGYTFKIKESRPRRDPKEYVAATKKYAGKVTLGSRGDLVNYVAGLPFPNISPSDPQAGSKLAWNWQKSWDGDDHKEGGGTASGKAVGYTIEKDGAERRTEIAVHVLRPSGRVTLAPIPAFPGFEHVEMMSLRATEYPRDTSGSTTLSIRYHDPERENDFLVYVPSIRRVHRAPPTQRCVTLVPSEFIFDDIPTFASPVTDYNYKFLGERQMLGNFSQPAGAYHRKPGDYLAIDTAWEVVNSYVLENTPKDSRGCYPRKVIYLDTSTSKPFWDQSFGTDGRLWKERWVFWAPVKLVDGQEVLTSTTSVIVNVQNGRSSIMISARAFNQGYQPSLFTLQTLQTVMRGGSLR